MIVRPRDNCKIERVRELQDFGLALLDHSDSLGRAVAQLHSHESCVAVQFGRWHLGEIPRNRENQDWWRGSHHDSGIACGIVPVSLGVVRERCVNPERYHMLVLIARLQRWQQHGAIASMCGITRQRRLCAEQRLVIADVCNVETSCRVPLAVALRREPLSRIP